MNRPRLAQDVMATKLITLTPTTPIFDGIARLLRSRVSGAPVVHGRREYAGVFSERSCLRVLSSSARFAHDHSAVKSLTAADVMTKGLVTLAPDMDVFDAIGYLLRHKISGAPVVDSNRGLVGIFSEKTSMSVLLEAAYAQIPTSTVSEFMVSDENSTIAPDVDLLEIVQLFLNTPYRRLQVIKDGKLAGQISPRDALRAAMAMSLSNPQRDEALRMWQEREGFGVTVASELDESQSMEVTESREQTEGEDESPAAPADQVSTFLNAKAKTISPDSDLLSIAHVFHGSSCRRLPVVDGGELVGQVSRRDLLIATNDLMKIEPKPQKPLLYLSSLVDRDESPIQ